MKIDGRSVLFLITFYNRFCLQSTAHSTFDFADGWSGHGDGGFYGLTHCTESFSRVLHKLEMNVPTKMRGHELVAQQVISRKHTLAQAMDHEHEKSEKTGNIYGDRS